MTPSQPSAVYWDSSAVLSALFEDRHSSRATAAIRQPGLHLLSTLAWAEVCAVIARIERERALTAILVAAARDALDRGPWRRLNLSPDWRVVSAMATKWALRGADLWHLGAAKTLLADLPDVKVLTFDAQLAAAARAEGLA